MSNYANDRQAHQAHEAQVYQLMPTGSDLHRVFTAPSHRPRKPTAASIAKRAAVVALVMVAVFVYFRFQLWDMWVPK